MQKYFNCHSHTVFSNIRLIDSINQPEKLIDKAIELGLSGIAITDHECLSAHIRAEKHMKKIQEKYPDFILALGNEIYLTDTRNKNQKYYHFILIAKDAIGHRALRELSSKAWLNSYVDRAAERVPTLKEELQEVVKKFSGHLIATSACIGGELPQNILLYQTARKINDDENALLYYQKIHQFLTFCQDLFKEDFYLECAPGTSPEQILVNQTLLKISQLYNIKLVVGTDAHYLTKEDRPVHKGYLNSKDGDREIDSFYEFTYLMDSEEVSELLNKSFDLADIQNILNNTLNLQNKITKYSLFHKQDIPSVEVKDYPINAWWGVNNDYADDMKNNFPTLCKLFTSQDIQDRYWINQCWDKLNEIGHGWNQYLENGDSKYLDELEEEARVKSIISEKLETNMFRYPNTLQHYIDLIWECGSMVGAGRGSSCAALNHYLMGITQLDPIKWDLPFFRYLNEERAEIGDIDLDLCPSKVRMILDKIAEERSHMFYDNVPIWAKEVFGCTRIATFGTEKTKSAILAACRGYRNEDYPEGIDVDQAQYMASLIPQERGFLWSIKEVVYGDKEKNRKPVTSFIREVNNYPGLLDIIMAIEGVINKRSSHASGILLFDKDPFEHCAFMKTPSGEIITQWDLHDVEYMGNTKYDMLVTEVQDKIVQTINFLQQDGELEQDLTLREIYNKYFHPEILPINDPKIWDALSNNSVINIFQFEGAEGIKAAKQLKPRSILEMSDANGLMRLMGEEGAERPIDKYSRFKNNISLWYKEMDSFGLTKAEQKTLEPYFKSSYGVPPSQEQLMKMLMDSNICNFSLGEANKARKIIGKKLMDQIPALREKVLSQAKSQKLGQYVWKNGVGPQVGYSFSLIHSLAYSFIGAQTLYLGTHWNPIYWDTACLVVNSGSLENKLDEEIELINENENEEDSKKKKTTNTDYGKIAKALNEIIDAGINVSLVNINNSDFGFKPDIKNNRILFGLKGLLNINDDLIQSIIKNRPYYSIKDFYQRIKPTKQAMISLIKAGAFDEMVERKLGMAWYIWETCDKKARLNLQNFSTLLKQGLVPLDTEEQQLSFRVYEFNRYLKTICKNSDIYPFDYDVDLRATEFLYELGYENLIENDHLLNIKKWDKVYQSYMNTFRKWLQTEGENVLEELNTRIFKADWDKYAKNANLSAWEMEVLCFYKHEHELSNVKKEKYGLKNFFDLPAEPEIEHTFYRGNKAINLFKLSRICGTCIAKNKPKSTVTILTTDGVVNVKFRKDYFALFDKQISEKGEDGKKHIIEKSWFNRGNMIMVQGIRLGDTFVTKKYKSSIGHQLYHILEVSKEGDLILQTERYKGDSEE